MTTTLYTDADRASWTHAATLKQMRGWWSDSDCVVVGCGPSAEGFRGEDYWTICCNRAVTHCDTDFAAAFEPRKDPGQAWEIQKQYSLGFVLSHRERDHPRVILTPDKRDPLVWLYDTPQREGEHALGQSTYFAILSAIVLGFKTIGVIGLDLTRPRYKVTDLRPSEHAYGELRAIADAEGRNLVNMSAISKLRAIPIGALDEVRPK